MKYLKLLIYISTLIFFIGCIDTDTVIKVKKDGSGTLEETVVLSNTITEMMQSMMSSFGGDTSKNNKEEFNLLDEDKLKEDARKMGEGVSFVSAREYKTDKGKGYKALYAFNNINKLRVNQNPGENVPSKPGDSITAEPEYISFEFKKDKVSTLKIICPKTTTKKPSIKKEIPEKAGGDSAKVDEQSIKAAKEMFGGMRVAISVEVDGEIVKTNATHKEGKHITIMEMDFAKLMETPEKLKEFVELNPNSVELVKKLAKDIPGIKVDLNDEIIVKFK